MKESSKQSITSENEKERLNDNGLRRIDLKILQTDIAYNNRTFHTISGSYKSYDLIKIEWNRNVKQSKAK